VKAVQASVLMVKPEGTVMPRRHISARLAPLPPSRFFMAAHAFGAFLQGLANGRHRGLLAGRKHQSLGQFVINTERCAHHMNSSMSINWDRSKRHQTCRTRHRGKRTELRQPGRQAHPAAGTLSPGRLKPVRSRSRSTTVLGDHRPMAATPFDHIIIGAGTAGSLLANRLSADPTKRVLLIEAGGKDDYHWIHIPVGYLYCIGNPRTDWLYQTEPDAGLNGRKLRYPRGKTLAAAPASTA
jgi:hypothetical protein